ncbi:tRNA (guanosine(46)-N7)-methyltransferase TrmB [Alphaproteobacteria bacterium]|nr:tRNA (guanosine(46)-N7)-methyltransferase TrmB [Alphaproteobacteria bacterium]
MTLASFKKFNRFYGRRKGRKLSETNVLALKEGSRYLIKTYNFCLNKKLVFEDLCGFKPKKIILEIGFGSGENLIKSAKLNSDILYVGADPFLNTNARCIKELLKNKITNVMIWPDDIRQIIDYFPFNSFSEIKILFPDPWPKLKHKDRRLIQNNFLSSLYNILIPQGTITLGTDHSIMKSWILESFQNHFGFEWKAKEEKDWSIRPSDCFSTKYEQKSIIERRKPNWFIFEKQIRNNNNPI